MFEHWDTETLPISLFQAKQRKTKTRTIYNQHFFFALENQAILGDKIAIKNCFHEKGI